MAVNQKSLNNLIPGARKGKRGGRAKCIETLDKMLARAGNQEKLDKDLQVKFDSDPGSFMRSFVFPLLPKDVNLTFENDVTMIIKNKAQQLVESIGDDFEKSELSEEK